MLCPLMLQQLGGGAETDVFSNDPPRQDANGAAILWMILPLRFWPKAMQHKAEVTDFARTLEPGCGIFNAGRGRNFGGWHCHACAMSGEGWAAATTPANARALSLRKVQSNVSGRRALGKAADGNIGNPSFRLAADSL